MKRKRENYHILRVSSADYNSGTSASKYSADFSITQDIHDITGIELLNFHVPNTLYNIRSGVNDRIVFDSVGTDYYAEVPAGNYTIDELLTALQTQLTSGGNSTDLTWVCSYDDSTMKVTISAASSFTLNWSTNANSTALIGKELGYDESSDSSSATSHTGTNVVNLIRLTEFIIEIRGFENLRFQNLGSDILPTGTFYIELEEERGVLTSISSDKKSYGHHCTFSNPRSLSQLHVTLRDPSDNSVLDFNGADWSMSLVLFQN